MRRRFSLRYLRLVEHACERCGAAVEDGTPFCSKCNAPQIRVLAESSGETVPATPPLEPGTPYDVQPPARPVPLGAAGIDWNHGRRAALTSGLIAAALSVFLFLFPIWLALAGFVCVGLYHRRSGQRVTGWIGAKLGAAAGVISFVLATALWIVLYLVDVKFFGGGQEFHDAFHKSIESAASSSPNGAEFLRFISTPEGLATFFVFAGLFYCAAFVLFAAAGGAAQGSRLRHK